MRVLIAEDDDASRIIVSRMLTDSRHELVITNNGADAWAILERDDAPRLAILDWIMPGMSGTEICRRVRAKQGDKPTYIILLAAKSSKAEIVEGLVAGANDYIVKPFDSGELRARVQVGVTVVDLQQKLAERVVELEEAFVKVKRLEGIIPICTYCKQVRDDQNYWQQVECYVSEHSDAKFSHGVCPSCYESVIVPQLEQMQTEIPRSE